VHTEGAVFDDASRFFEARGSDVSRIRAVAIVAVEWAAALISPAYGGGATEPEVIERFTRRFESIYGWQIEPSGAGGDVRSS
jgi:hypothetical protein